MYFSTTCNTEVLLETVAFHFAYVGFNIQMKEVLTSKLRTMKI